MENSFKNLILSANEPRVLLENGEPRFVVVPWREFEAMRRSTVQSVHFAEIAEEALDVPIFAPIRRQFAKLVVDTAKIRLEDLPI